MGKYSCNGVSALEWLHFWRIPPESRERKDGNYNVYLLLFDQSLIDIVKGMWNV